MKQLLITLLVIVSYSGFSQSKKTSGTLNQQADSALVLPLVVTLRFTREQIDFLNAILSEQDVSHKAWSEFVLSYNRQLVGQQIKVPIKKDTATKK